MRTKLFGRSGLRVSEFCLGTMAFGRAGSNQASRRDCEAMLRAFADRGGNFVETSPTYGDGEAEWLVGALVAADRARWVLSTRAHVPTSVLNPRGELILQVEGSLRRLGTDHVDLLWLDGWSEETPLDDVMASLQTLVCAGKVRCVGAADSPTWVVAQANTLAAMNGWMPFVGLQIEYSLAERSAEQHALPLAEAFGLTVCPWGALAGGALAGKRGRAGAATERVRCAAQRIREVALDLGQAPAKVALSWLRQQAANLVPIVGARTLSQLLESLDCVELRLTSPQLRRLSGRALIERREHEREVLQVFA